MIWVDNGNVVRGLGKRLGVERADAVWAVAEDWTGSSGGPKPSLTAGGCNWVGEQMVAPAYGRQ